MPTLTDEQERVFGEWYGGHPHLSIGHSMRFVSDQKAAFLAGIALGRKEQRRDTERFLRSHLCNYAADLLESEPVK